LSTQLALRAVRRCRWPEVALVEGAEAVVWPAVGEEDDRVEALPPRADGVAATLSWARPKVLRFETAAPEPLPEMLLVSTLSESGPANFVVRKQYQKGRTAVYDPPVQVHIVERRDLFRVPVSTRVTLPLDGEDLVVYSVDCSIGGMRICPPKAVQMGAELDLRVELGAQKEVALRGVVRHCKPFTGPRGTGRLVLPGDQPMSVGLQFVDLRGDLERQLSYFVGHHQRRLMPKVAAVLPADYRSHGHRQFLEVFTKELSPGDVVLNSPEPHLPGDYIELRLRARREAFSFNGRALSCDLAPGRHGSPPRYLVRVFLEDSGDAAGAGFRKVVRELAVEKT